MNAKEFDPEKAKAAAEWMTADNLILEYDPINGHVEPDGKIDRWLEEQIAEWMVGNGPKLIRFGNEIMLARFRLMTVRETVNREAACVLHEGKVIEIHVTGSLTEWPNTLCNLFSETLRDMAMRRRIIKQRLLDDAERTAERENRTAELTANVTALGEAAFASRQQNQVNNENG